MNTLKSTQETPAPLSTQSPVWWALLLLLTLRLISLGLYPLMDNTEARYAEIARVMGSTGDWVTPWFANGIPFWGKPPLSFWSTSLSFAVLGVNEFAARLPHFLTALGVGWLIWDWALRQGKQEALTAISLLAACSLTLIASGAVMTDMTLVLGSTLVMRGFWLALHGKVEARGREAGLFFLGLVIGLLAKGPLVLVLAGLPVGLWTLLTRQYARVWHALPWWRGSLLVLALVAPWYIAAELRTPGFLDYFLVGEHWHRFVTPGWSGDRYGGAHSAPWGSIWAYVWFAVLPWSLFLPLAWWRWRKGGDVLAPLALGPVDSASQEGKSLQNYLVWWSLAPALFFTFAGNILWTYALPALPPLALLAAAWLCRQYSVARVNQLLARGLVTGSVMLATFVVVLNLKSMEDFQTTKALVTDYKVLNNRDEALFFYPARPYSAAFYSLGQARPIAQASDLVARLAWPHTFLAVNTLQEASLPAEVRLRLHFLVQRGEYKLFEMGHHVSADAVTAQPKLAKP